MEYVKIPLSRVAVLIGKEGETKKEIESRLSVKLSINSEEGVVEIENRGEDVLAEWKARDIVRAIARGINPEKALVLCSDEYVLEVIDLEEIVGKSEKSLLRQRGRIIGEGGKTRKFIEETTGCYISIAGKDVAIVGTLDELRAAKEAVMMLASGAPHGVVYKTLQKKARELKEKRFQLWKKV